MCDQIITFTQENISDYVLHGDVDVIDAHGKSTLSWVIDNLDMEYSVEYISYIVDKTRDLSIHIQKQSNPVEQLLQNARKSSQKCLEITKILVEKGKLFERKDFDINESVKCVLDFDEKDTYHTTNIIDYLIKKGLNPNLSNIDEWTLLHHYVYHGFNEQTFKCVKRLIKCGANINAKSNYGTTPIMISSGNSKCHYSHSILLELLRARANINDVDSEGNSAIVYAVHNITPSLRTLRLLLDYGADVNLKNKKGENAVTRALCSYDITKNDTVVLLLINSGFDNTYISNTGNTIFEIAMSNNVSPHIYYALKHPMAYKPSFEGYKY